MLPSLPSSLWAARVAAATPLPDARLHTRLERLLSQQAEKPLDAFPQALPDRHQAKATYRFLANDRVCHDDLLTGWRVTTAQALRGHDVIYVAHETTTFNHTALKQTTGLGYISDLEAARGFHCHGSLALQRNGVALGLLHQYYWARTESKKLRPQGTRHRRQGEYQVATSGPQRAGGPRRRWSRRPACRCRSRPRRRAGHTRRRRGGGGRGPAAGTFTPARRTGFRTGSSRQRSLTTGFGARAPTDLELRAARRSGTHFSRI